MVGGAWLMRVRNYGQALPPLVAHGISPDPVTFFVSPSRGHGRQARYDSFPLSLT